MPDPDDGLLREVFKRLAAEDRLDYRLFPDGRIPAPPPDPAPPPEFPGVELGFDWGPSSTPSIDVPEPAPVADGSPESWVRRHLWWGAAAAVAGGALVLGMSLSAGHDAERARAHETTATLAPTHASTSPTTSAGVEPTNMYSSEIVPSTYLCGPARLDVTFRANNAAAIAPGTEALVTEHGPGIEGRSTHVPFVDGTFRVQETVTVTAGSEFGFDLTSVGGAHPREKVSAGYGNNGC